MRCRHEVPCREDGTHVVELVTSDGSLTRTTYAIRCARHVADYYDDVYAHVPTRRLVRLAARPRGER